MRKLRSSDRNSLNTQLLGFALDVWWVTSFAWAPMSDSKSKSATKTVRRVSNRIRKPESSANATEKREVEEPMPPTQVETHTETSGKRPNRRRGGKGNPTHREAPPVEAMIDARATSGEAIADVFEPAADAGMSEAEEHPPEPSKTARDSTKRQGNAGNPPPGHRPKHDVATLADKAWKIYLAEVSEEGVALIHDHDARELARRCFRLAQIFLDEQTRH